MKQSVFFGILVVVIVTCATATGVNTTTKARCNRQYVMCACGREKTAPSVGVIVETCRNLQSGLCQPCQETKNICNKFSVCRKCSEGVDRCVECPERKAGKWCEHDCACQNEGYCDINGICICLTGFNGTRCEKIVDRSDVVEDNRDKRQAPASANTGTKAACPLLPAPDNGNVHIETDAPTEGVAIKYTCKENFTMLGSRTRHCQRKGQWTGEAPTCEKMCPFPPITSYLKVEINPDRIGAPLYDSFNNEVISELGFTCDFGYTVVGSSRIRCASGVWDQEVPSCRVQVDCDDPGMPDNAERDVQGPMSEAFKVGTQLTYRCKGDNTLVGAATLTCMPFRSWSALLPVCLPNVVSECSCTCKTPGGVQNNLQKVNEPLTCSTESQPGSKIVLKP